MSNEPSDARLRAPLKNVFIKLVVQMELDNWQWVRQLVSAPATAASRRLPRSAEVTAGLRIGPYLKAAAAEVGWPMMRLVDTQGATTMPIFPIPSPNAIVLLVGDNTPEGAVREAFDRAMLLLREQQQRHRGKPRKSAKLRTDSRVERAAFFLWMNSTRRFGKPLGPERIGNIWEALTEDWADAPARPSNTDAVPHSLHKIPEAWLAWIDWSTSNSPGTPTAEQLGKDAVRAILADLPPYAPRSQFELEAVPSVRSPYGGRG